MTSSFRPIIGYLQAALRAYFRSTIIVAVVVMLTALAVWPVLRMADATAPLDATRAVLPVIPSAGLEAPGSFTTRPPQLTQQHASDALYRFALGSGLALMALGLLTALSLGGARTSERMPEFAIRRAMGSSRGLLRWSVTIEGLVVALLAAVLLLPLIPVAEQGILARWPGDWQAAAVDFLLLCLGILTGGAIASLLLPYLVSPRPRLSGEVAQPISLLLPAAQMAASLVILVGGGLALRFAEQQVKLGDQQHAPGIVVALHDDGPPAQRSGRYSALLARLLDSVGIESASLGSPGLRLGLGTVETVLTDCGDCADGMIRTKLKPLLVTEHLASPDTFRALGVSLVAGRTFALSDHHAAPLVAVVTRSLAQRGFQYGEALGREVRVRTRGPGANPDGDWFRVVGIVDDFPGAGYGAGQQPSMGLFLSVLQRPPADAELLLRGPRQEHALDGMDSLMILDRRAESDVLLATLAPTRWFGQLYAFLGWAILVIGGLGSLVVMRAWLISLIPELGLRAAVGASRVRLAGLIAGRLLGALALALGLALWIIPGVSITLSRILGADIESGYQVLLGYAAVVGVGAAIGIALPLIRVMRTTPAGLIEHTAE